MSPPSGLVEIPDPPAADAAAAEPPTRPAPIANAAVVKTAFFMIHLA
jgi:hypothetical protein